MKSFLILGLSTFGQHLCAELNKAGCDVMIADSDPAVVEMCMADSVSAKIADCTDINVLSSFGVSEFDACFVCLGGHFGDALEITYLLKFELGAKKVISEINRDIEEKFMLRNGADKTVYPEKDMAGRVAVSESSDKIFDAVSIADGFSVFEISVPEQWLGKSLRELNIRAKHNISVIAVIKDGKPEPVVSPDAVFKKNEHLMLLGKNTDIKKLIK